MKRIDYRKLCHPTHPEFRLANSPFYLMAHADFDYHEDMSKVLKKHGVDRSMYRFMTVLREHDSANIGFLAERALTKPSTASRIVERMISKGLVDAAAHPDDSRVTLVALSERGKEMLDVLTPIVGRQFQRAIAGIDDEELEQLVLTLQRISSNLNRLAIEASEKGSRAASITGVALPAGQAWSVSAVTAHASLSRVEVLAGAGRGIRLHIRKPSVVLRTALKAAKQQLYAHGARLLEISNLKTARLRVDVHPLGEEPAGCSSLALWLALCSAVSKQPIRAGLVIAGELNGDVVASIEQPVSFVDAAVRGHARAILLPVSCRRELTDLPDDVVTQIEILFYANAADALAKAMHP